MRIISFDVGLKNLAYCIIDNKSIDKWENLCIPYDKKQSLEITVENLLTSLSETFGDVHADTVLIENQPRINGLMKTISVAIYTFFNMLKIMHGSVVSVRFISAQNKLKCKHASSVVDQSTYKSTYKERKKAAIEITRKYLSTVFAGCQKQEWFEGQRKKDDLSDCFLQAMFWMETRA